MTTPTPPRLADGILRLLLAPYDRDSVSGDLLEEYRQSIYPTRGRVRAGLWFWSQVSGYAWRSNRPFASLLAAALLARTAVDWLVPPSDFHARSAMSTAVAAGILMAAGFRASWRSGSIWTGALAGIATTLAAATIAIAGSAALLGVYHDPQTLAAIEQSGGLGEVFTLPITMVLPGVGLGMLGALCSGACRKLLRLVS